MARVTGIGGVFLRSADPKRLTAWYAEHLGFEPTDWGVMFQWKDGAPEGDGLTVWSAFSDASDKFEGDQRVAINYRVDDMDGLLAKLEAAGVWIDPNRIDESYGKFAWIKDCDNNRIELWQP